MKKVIYFRESALQSIIADAVTFGFLILMMTLNFKYWGGHWYVTLPILIMWLVFVAGKANAKSREFHSLDDAIAALEAEKSK